MLHFVLHDNKKTYYLGQGKTLYYFIINFDYFFTFV